MPDRSEALLLCCDRGRPSAKPAKAIRTVARHTASLLTQKANSRPLGISPTRHHNPRRQTLFLNCPKSLRGIAAANENCEPRMTLARHCALGRTWLYGPARMAPPGRDLAAACRAAAGF